MAPQKLYFNRLTRRDIISVVGFFIIILLIPSLMLIAKHIILKKDSNAKLINYEPVTHPKKNSTNSPLDQLKNLIQKQVTTPTPDPTTTQGPTLSFKTQIQGRPLDQQQSKVFIGIAEGPTMLHPQFLLTYLVDIPHSGEYSGISLAGLTAGTTYTAYIKGPGQIDSSSSFIMGSQDIILNQGQPIVLLSGDVNDDNTINNSDLQIVSNLYGNNQNSANWNDHADFNNDGVINPLDGSILLSNLGKTGASGLWASTPYPSEPKSASSSASLSIGGISESTSSGGYWLYLPHN